MITKAETTNATAIAVAAEKPAIPAIAAAITLLAAMLLAAASFSGCGHAQTPEAFARARELVLSYDDNRPSASLSFPNLTYESLIRFELPPGKHHPLRLRALLGSTGTLEIAFYENSVLESPGNPLHHMTWIIDAADVSTGKDGRWVVSDLKALPALEGIIWIGVRKTGGNPAIWTSAASSGQTFLRDRNPAETLGILPVKRTPMLRLELLL